MIRVAGVFFLLIGLGALAGAGWIIVSNIRFKASAEKTVGTIVKLERRASTTTARRGRAGGTTTTWAPVFEFADANGSTQRVTSSYSSSITSRRVGEKVPVFYPRDEPHRARIDSFASFWPGPLICLVLAVVFSAFGMAMVRKPRGR